MIIIIIIIITFGELLKLMLPLPEVRIVGFFQSLDGRKDENPTRKTWSE